MKNNKKKQKEYLLYYAYVCDLCVIYSYICYDITLFNWSEWLLTFF